MNEIITFIINNGAGIVAIAIIFWQYQTYPRVLRSLETTIKDSNTLSHASVKTLEKISDRLSDHEKEVCTLEAKLDNATTNLQKGIENIKQDTETLKEEITKLKYRDRE